MSIKVYANRDFGGVIVLKKFNTGTGKTDLLTGADLPITAFISNTDDPTSAAPIAPELSVAMTYIGSGGKFAFAFDGAEMLASRLDNQPALFVMVQKTGDEWAKIPLEYGGTLEAVVSAAS